MVKIKGISENAVDFIRKQIIVGDLKPKSRLNELELSSILGVSRAPVREAFNILEKDNLIVRVPRRGTYVADLSVDALKKVYQARLMIESFSVDLFEKEGVTNFIDAEVAIEEALKHSFSFAKAKESKIEDLFIFGDFHLGIIKATQNIWLIDFYQSITWNLARFQYFCMNTPGFTDGSLEMHIKILETLKDGQFRYAKDLMSFHVKNVVNFIKEQIEGIEKKLGVQAA